MTGRGVFAAKTFRTGDFILEYRGYLLEKQPNEATDSYLYEFQHNGKRMW